LRDDNWIQSRVAQCEAKLSAANAWLVQLAREAWNECEATGEVGFELRIRLRLASTFAIHQAREVVDTAYTEAGTTSIFRSNPFERRMRDMHTVSQQVQASVSHFQSVGQHFLGAAPSVRFI
jgi:alkylation response protein AidB-like acyl-CoA dehydrogenase